MNEESKNSTKKLLDPFARFEEQCNKYKNLTEEQLANLIWLDDEHGNHYFTFIENELIGVKDSNQKTIIQPNHFKIVETGIMNREIAGWNRRPSKDFLVLLDQKKIWFVYHLKNNKYLDKTFVRTRKVNGSFYFIAEDTSIWELDYYTEDFIPAKYNSIEHGFRHGELSRKADTTFVNYLEKYPDNFISQYTDTEDEKNSIKSIYENIFESYISFDNPFSIFEDIKKLKDDEDYKEETLLLLKYLNKILLPINDNKKVKYHKYYKKLWLDTQKLINDLSN